MSSDFDNDDEVFAFLASFFHTIPDLLFIRRRKKKMSESAGVRGRRRTTTPTTSTRKSSPAMTKVSFLSTSSLVSLSFILLF